jgi:hypothetical protein
MSVRWLIATALVMLVFGVMWAVSAGIYDLGKAASLEVAAVSASAIGLPLSWWSFRGQLLDEPPEVAWVTWRRMPGVPPLPLPRPKDEARLESAFRPGPTTQVVVLTGPPGVGKTQLAAGYARARIAEGWPLVAWINSGSHEEMMAGMLEFADALSLRVPEEGSARAVDRLRHHPPAGTRPSLIIFDGVSDPDSVRPYLPAVGGWRVIVTTNAPDAGQLGTEVALEPAATAELATQTGLPESTCRKLGRLAAALDLAAATVREQPAGAEPYLDRLRTVAAGRLLGDGQDGSRYEERYPAGAAEAILIALRDAGFDTDPVVRRLLAELTVLAPGGASRGLLAQGEDNAEIEDALARLTRWSLVSVRMDGDAVLLHRLVRQVVDDRLRTDNALPSAIAEVADVLDRATFGEELAWDRRAEGDQLIAHISALSTAAGSVAASLPADTMERVLGLRQWATRQLSAVGDGNRAVELAESIRQECDTLLGPEHPDTLAASDNLAIAYVAARRAVDGIPLAEEVLSTRARVLGEEHQDTLASRYTLAYVHEYAGDLEDAATLYDRAYTEYARVFGVDHPQTVIVAGALARVRAITPARVAGRHRTGSAQRPTPPQSID